MQLHHDNHTSTHRNPHRSIYSVYADLHGTAGTHALSTAGSLPSIPAILSRAQTEAGVIRPAPLSKRSQSATGGGRTLPLMGRSTSSHGLGIETDARITRQSQASLKDRTGYAEEGEEDYDALPLLMIRRSVSRSHSNTFAPTPTRIPLLQTDKGDDHHLAYAAPRDIPPLTARKSTAGGSDSSAAIDVQESRDRAQERDEEKEVEALLIPRMERSAGSGSFDTRPLRVSPSKSKSFAASVAFQQTVQWRVNGATERRDAGEWPREYNRSDEDEEEPERGEGDQDEIDIDQLERALDQLKMEESDDIAEDLHQRIFDGTAKDGDDWFADCEFSHSGTNGWGGTQRSGDTSKPVASSVFATWGGPRSTYASTVGSTISRGRNRRLKLSMDLYGEDSGSGIPSATRATRATRDKPGQASTSSEQNTEDAYCAADDADRRHKEPACTRSSSRERRLAGSIVPSAPSEHPEQDLGGLRSRSPRRQPPIYLSKISTIGAICPPKASSPVLSPRLGSRAHKSYASRSPRMTHTRPAVSTLWRSPGSPKLEPGETVTRPLQVLKHRALRPRQRPRRSASFTLGAADGPE